MEWRAATIHEVSKIVEHDLTRCGGKQAAIFGRYRVDLYVAPLCRYGKDESAVIVARRLDEVIYWEDVEEGFNRSRVDDDGRILQHLCNQDDLCVALRGWTEDDFGKPSHVSGKSA